jgi:hypothetical protein
MKNHPEKGDGWNFDEQETWQEAFETDENGEIDLDQYDEFDNMHELAAHVSGQDGTRSYKPGEEDLQMKKQEMMNDRWEVPGKIEQISEYLEQEENLTPNEINLDPAAESEIYISQQEARSQNHDTKYTMTFVAYDPDEQPENGVIDATFSIEGSWYDKEPSQMNLEEIFESVYEE